ncbi:MAG: FAD:protein FMN transferase [Saprospiraceae bacterium]|nr:FAD:protein FMN transferase [Saprospiraceae bacterium]
MNKANFKSIILLLVITVGVYSCQPPEKYHKVTGSTMGTYYAITYKGSNPAQFKKEIDQILIDFNMSVSTYIEESTISKLNSNKEGIRIPENDPFFIPVFKKADVLYELTGGDLNTSVAPLVNYWGFGYKGKDQISRVDSLAVDSLLQIVQRTSFELKENDSEAFISKSIPEAEIDFSSLAKGYGIDVLAKYFEDKKIEDFLIDIGGEARAKGVNNVGETWKLAINKPKEDAPVDDLEIILKLDNQSLATSGNYRIYYEKGGRKFAHILNPKTGYSALSNLLSASVLAEDCMTADGLATALMVKGLEGAKEFLSKNKIPACLIYDADGDEDLEKFYANGFKKSVVKER